MHWENIGATACDRRPCKVSSRFGGGEDCVQGLGLRAKARLGGGGGHF